MHLITAQEVAGLNPAEVTSKLRGSRKVDLFSISPKLIKKSELYITTGGVLNSTELEKIGPKCQLGINLLKESLLHLALLNILYQNLSSFPFCNSGSY